MPSLPFLVQTILTMLTVPVRLFAISLWYTRRANRPNPTWSFKTAFSMQIIYSWFRYCTTVNWYTPKSLDPGKDGDRFIVINPSSSTTKEVYAGTLVQDSLIQPLPIGAAWYSTTPSKPPRRLILHFHPGAYVLCGPRPSEGGGWGPSSLSELSEWPLLSVQYRLSLDENTHFPAALQDGITAYAYALNTLGIPPSEIVLSGESAGGNLVLAMLHYLATENQDHSLPLPRAALLWHPWVDMTKAATDAIDHHRLNKSDYLFSELAEWGASRYIPSNWARNHPYFSPLGNERRLSVPLFIQTGTAEVQYDEHTKYAHNMEMRGTDVELHKVSHASHAIFSCGEALGMPDAAIEGHARAARFIQKARNNL
ncbi:Alpha/Beta hydrolase protein [Penicillium angulare]|uniref:Alpha/Beta hydrolase protein n=1 Tax=Penicillium angulare TaxID=116970 RepID=A0A9W9K6H6_9EURO|nr:Alpha/Beta hydrolase protein [Penicillium angulare]